MNFSAYFFAQILELFKNFTSALQRDAASCLALTDGNCCFRCSSSSGKYVETTIDVAILFPLNALKTVNQQDSHHLDFPDVARKNRDVGGGTVRNGYQIAIGYTGATCDEDPRQSINTWD